MNNILTCVYCGQAYPEGTPPHGSQILTDHIRICEKHPMRQIEQERNMLRKALMGLITGGGDLNKSELEQMELTIRISSAPEQDKISALNAIHALIETSTN